MSAATNQALIEALGLTHLRVTRIDIKARPAQNPIVTVEAFLPGDHILTTLRSFHLVPIEPLSTGKTDGGA